MKWHWLLWLLWPTLAWGEYRTYELLITNSTSGNTRTVVSTLDHIQYPYYYPLNQGETIQYVDSWMCWGNTEKFKPLCPKPESEN